jgi:hypothetical protein
MTTISKMRRAECLVASTLDHSGSKMGDGAATIGWLLLILCVECQWLDEFLVE